MSPRKLDPKFVSGRFVPLAVICILVLGACGLHLREDRSASVPFWSPDGQYALFTIIDLYDDNIEITGRHICLLEFAGESRSTWLKNAVTNIGREEVQWSPDSRRLAFSSGPGIAQDVDIFVFDIKTQKVSRLTKLDGDSLQPEWSPDSDRLAFIRYEEGWYQWWKSRAGATAVYIVNADGSDLQELIKVPEGKELDFGFQQPWSPDGDKLIFRITDGGTAQFHIADIEMRQITALTNQQGGYNEDYQWSPDGKWISFVSRPSGDANQGVYVIDKDGRNFAYVMDVGDKDVNVDWAPDSTHFALLLERGDESPEVFMATADGSQVVPLAVVNSVTGGRDRFGWSPDGKRIAVLQNRGDPLFIADTSTHESIYVAPQSGFYWHSLWNWSPDGHWIAVRAKSDSKTGIFLVNPENGELHTVIISTSRVGEPVWMSTGEVLAFIEYHDGKSPVAFVVDLEGKVLRRIPWDCGKWPGQ
jgi:Tol biopolymer transport system component